MGRALIALACAIGCVAFACSSGPDAQDSAISCIGSGCSDITYTNFLWTLEGMAAETATCAALGVARVELVVTDSTGSVAGRWTGPCNSVQQQGLSSLLMGNDYVVAGRLLDRHEHEMTREVTRSFTAGQFGGAYSSPTDVTIPFGLTSFIEPPPGPRL